MYGNTIINSVKKIVKYYFCKEKKLITLKLEKGVEKYTNKIMEKLSDPRFREDARLISAFDSRFTKPESVSGFDIVMALIETNTEFLRIGFYTQNWWAYKFTPVNGYVDGTGRNMFLNTRQLWRDPRDIEETIWHEMVHVSDAINKNMVYWHGDNKLAGKDKTAPVKFAAWAARWIHSSANRF